MAATTKLAHTAAEVDAAIDKTGENTAAINSISKCHFFGPVNGTYTTLNDGIYGLINAANAYCGTQKWTADSMIEVPSIGMVHVTGYNCGGWGVFDASLYESSGDVAYRWEVIYRWGTLTSPRGYSN